MTDKHNHNKCINNNESYCWCLISGMPKNINYKDLYMEEFEE
jgi:hypothetical protein